MLHHSQGNGFSPVFVGAPCATAAEAFGQPIFAGGAQPPAPATPAPAPATQPPTLKGGAKLIGFSVPLCRNTDFANLNGVGKVQPTGPCTQDTDCQQNCCDGARCRIPFALKTGVEFCRNGTHRGGGGAPLRAEFLAHIAIVTAH